MALTHTIFPFSVYAQIDAIFVGQPKVLLKSNTEKNVKQTKNNLSHDFHTRIRTHTLTRTRIRSHSIQVAIK